MLVQKFGGTSLEDAPALERLCRIVEGSRDRGPVVVVSAMGDTTDDLIDLADRQSLPPSEQILQ